jgi:hypothetical protein
MAKITANQPIKTNEISPPKGQGEFAISQGQPRTRFVSEGEESASARQIVPTPAFQFQATSFVDLYTVMKENVRRILSIRLGKHEVSLKNRPFFDPVCSQVCKCATAQCTRVATHFYKCAKRTALAHFQIQKTSVKCGCGTLARQKRTLAPYGLAATSCRAKVRRRRERHRDGGWRIVPRLACRNATVTRFVLIGEISVSFRVFRISLPRRSAIGEGGSAV